MKRISVYFRDEMRGWENLNLSFDPALYINSKQCRLLEIACDFDIFGNKFMSKKIERFILHESVVEIRFDLKGDGRYFYIIRREED